MAHCDIVSRCGTYLDHVIETILGFLDGSDLKNAELVCKYWRQLVIENHLWQRALDKQIRRNNVLLRVSQMDPMPAISRDPHCISIAYKRRYLKLQRQAQILQNNWRSGNFIPQSVPTLFLSTYWFMHLDNGHLYTSDSRGIIRKWNTQSLLCLKIYRSLRNVHTMTSATCFQVGDEVIIVGTEVGTIEVWDKITCEWIKTINLELGQPVKELCLGYGYVVSLSYILQGWCCQSFVTITKFQDPRSMSHGEIHNLPNAYCCLIQLTDKFVILVVSSGNDLKKISQVIQIRTFEFVLVGTIVDLRSRIFDMQCNNGLLVTASEDNKIRFWNPDTRNCIKVLHEEGVLCTRFNSEYLIACNKSGQVKVFDIKVALNPSSQRNEALLFTKEVAKYITNVELDEFQFAIKTSLGSIIICNLFRQK